MYGSGLHFFFFFTVSLSHFGKQTHSNVSLTWVGGKLCIGHHGLRLSCCTNSSTPLKSFLPLHRQLQNAHKYSRYSQCYGAAFILQIGVFVLQTFFRGRGLLSSQCAELRKKQCFSGTYMSSKLKWQWKNFYQNMNKNTITCFWCFWTMDQMTKHLYVGTSQNRIYSIYKFVSL